jgi:hypothetical protein
MLRQQDHKFEARLCYTVRPYLKTTKATKKTPNLLKKHKASQAAWTGTEWRGRNILPQV